MAKPDYPWRRLGELLVERGLIVQSELRRALAEQKASGRKLGEILVEQAAVTSSQLARILVEQAGLNLESGEPEGGQLEPPAATEATLDPNGLPWRPLGRVLLDRGALSEPKLDEALQVQRTSGRRLGEILVERGYVSTQTLVSAVIEQHGLEGAAASTGFTATPLSTPSGELYQLEDHTSVNARAVFRSEGFLDAVDFAFEYLEAEHPSQLRIFRIDGRNREEVWAYDEPQSPKEAAKPRQLVELYGYDVTRWRAPGT
jgi:hypothetical protein